jgi:hypothetical protein
MESANMAVHIQEVLGQYVGPILAQYAQNDLGLDEAQAFKSVEKAIPAVLAGVINHVGDEHAAKRFFNLLTGTNVDTKWLDAGVLQGDKLAQVQKLGGQWLGLLFGNRGSEVEQAVAQDAGLEDTQASGIMALAIPTVLAALKQWIQQNQYGQHQFYGQLVAQESFFSKIFSPKLLAALGIPSALTLVAGIRSWGDQYFAEKATVAATAEAAPLRNTPPPVAPVTTEKSGMAWAKWVLGIIVLGALAWMGKAVFLDGQPPSAPAASSSCCGQRTSCGSAPALTASVPAASRREWPVSLWRPVAWRAASEPAATATDRTVFENGALKFYFATGSAKISADATRLGRAFVGRRQRGQEIAHQRLQRRHRRRRKQRVAGEKTRPSGAQLPEQTRRVKKPIGIGEA